MVQRVQLRVTGDDFGRSAAINQACVRDWEGGFLTHTSLMPGASAAAEAVELSRNCRGLKTGLHLTLCDGHALTDCPLADGDRCFPESAGRAGWMLWARRGDSGFMRGVREEIEAQFSWLRKHCAEARHWDGHHHLHLHPVIFPIATHFAAQHGFERVRLLVKPDKSGVTSLILSRLSRMARQAARRGGQVFDDRVYGFARTGAMREDRLFHALRRIERVPPGQHVELYYHPGAEPEALREDFGAWAKEAFPAIRWEG